MEREQTISDLTCKYAAPGHYNHECGAAQTHVAVFNSNSTVSGRFYVGRCEEHIALNDGFIDSYPDPHNKCFNTWK